MNAITLQGLTKQFGANEVLKGVNLQIAEGEFYALMGPNGSGKTTLASIIASIRKPTAGKAEIYGRPPEQTIGLIIGTFIKHLQGAIMTGVGIAVITAAISGLFAPYSALPSPLQLFSRFYPVSSAGASATCVLLGEEMVGYNPLTTGQISLTIGLSLFLLILGIVLYSRLSWKSE